MPRRRKLKKIREKVERVKGIEPSFTLELDIL